MTSDAVPASALLSRHWITAIRPLTLPAAVAPVLVGTAAAASIEDSFRLAIFIATLAAAILIQIGTNFANDVFDFEHGADTTDRLGPPRVTQSGLISPERVRLGTGVAFGGAAAIGVYLIVVGGWPILAIGVLSILAGIAYTGGPWPLGYHGLGDVAVFAFFGMTAVIGTYYLQANAVSATVVVAAVPVGLLVTAILVVNNLRDIETDRRAGKRTLAVRIGDRATRLQYMLLILGPYALTPVLWAMDAGAWVLLACGSLPIALILVRAVLSGTTGRGLNDILKRTALLHFAFGGLLALGLLL
ncbi:MAG: 1,4-dihydroxy-2-naphthoate polyprenyltransferase [Chloroflexi bacterium]|nr:1,4-dihydroxy-2-naphthoate polyprenyltransferase [Chloroflexota bacterium]